ncbi:MAG: YggS family pyridoxal phosphate-dependent enzyme [Lachnospiraceae bacterium]|jgi:pyridoxal phosphate enzyme (YggS family)|nr:YggS family pyridoxal phosphate-dependent enzyme [Lachnospiraceae bacterium]
MIRENLEDVEEFIQSACIQSNRRREDVTLIAVSKTHPASDIQDAYDLGIRDFGENKVQELVSKIEVLPSDIHWHMIGHLQKNKVKQIVGKVALIHSVDSYSLLEKINSEASKKNVIQNVLLEVNVAEEESKFGFKSSEVLNIIRKSSDFSNVLIKGLMTVAPNVSNSEENRGIFKELYKLFIDINNENIDNIHVCELSMGMSGDYQVAISEGATLIRVGTAIFGERDYSIK